MLCPPPLTIRLPSIGRDHVPKALEAPEAELRFASIQRSRT